jgi:hypothetical protein
LKLLSTSDGTLRASEPNMSSRICSTMSPTASVIINTASGGSRRSGRTRMRSIAIPNSATRSTAMIAATTSGTCRFAVSV